ncbi:MAG: hypothetical protein VB144_05955 [Clostridia bacterium]|nr:hypothetical protein [Clostridia bacterium]
MPRKIACGIVLLILVCMAGGVWVARAGASGPGPAQAPGRYEYEVMTTELPMHSGMYMSFRRTIEHAVTDYTWQVTVHDAKYPDWADIGWVWSLADGSLGPAGTRRLKSLSRGRTFGPNFGQRDPKETDWTAPWVSKEVLHELRTGGVAYNFRVGNLSLTGVFAGDLRVEEEILFPVEVNGKRVYLPAYRCMRGQLTIWNNSQNPLVLEYQPIGIPLITGVFGWKVESISIGGAV